MVTKFSVFRIAIVAIALVLLTGCAASPGSETLHIHVTSKEHFVAERSCHSYASLLRVLRSVDAPDLIRLTVESDVTPDRIDDTLQVVASAGLRVPVAILVEPRLAFTQ